MRKIILAGLAVTLAGCGASTGIQAGPASSTSSTTTTTTTTATSTSSGPHVFAIGDTGHVTNDGQPEGTLTVSLVSTSTQPVDQYGDAPANGMFVTVKVIAQAAPGITQTFDINPLDFYVLEPSGAHYDMSAGNAIGNQIDPQLQAVSLGAGENTTGDITFDVPSPHGMVVYSPNYDSMPIGEWRF